MRKSAKIRVRSTVHRNLDGNLDGSLKIITKTSANNRTKTTSKTIR